MQTINIKANENEIKISNPIRKIYQGSMSRKNPIKIQICQEWRIK